MGVTSQREDEVGAPCAKCGTCQSSAALNYTGDSLPAAPTFLGRLPLSRWEIAE